MSFNHILVKVVKGVSSFSRAHTWSIAILVTYVALSIAYLLPHLLFPSFNLIDDGLSLEVATVLKNDRSLQTWSSQLYEVQHGRLRPLYFLYFFVVRLFFGTHPAVYWWGQVGVLCATLLLVSYILYSLTKIKWVSFLSPLFLLFLPSTAENFYRLGTAEPRQMFFIVCFIAWVILATRKSVSLVRIGIGAVALLSAYFAKESAIMLFPAFLYIWILQVQTKKWPFKKHFFLLAVFGILTLGFYFLIPPRVEYTAGYQVSPAQLIKNLYVIRFTIPHLFWLASVFSALFAARVGIRILQKKKLWDIVEENTWQGFFLVLIFVSIALVIPWPYQLNRYYYSTHVFILFFAVLESVAAYRFWWRERHIDNFLNLGFLAAAFLLIFVSAWKIFPRTTNLIALPMQSFQHMSGWLAQYQYSYALISYLQSVPEGTKIYDAHNDYEVTYEMGIFTSRYSERPATILSQDSRVARDFGTRFMTVNNVFQAFENDPSPQKILLVHGKIPENVRYTKDIELWPSSPLVAKNPTTVWHVLQ